MKINNQKDQVTNQDLTEMFARFQEENRNVFLEQFQDQIFFYRALGRSEYKNILIDDRFNDMQKEELICQLCVLWPENFDFEDCDAGIPTMLMKSMLKNSYLDAVDSRKKVLDFYREEMFDLDNQITCIINEAFPNIDIEDIEMWGIEKTTKYLSRAEWKLHNLRGMEFYDTQSQESYYEKNEKEDPSSKKSQTEEVGNNKVENNIRGGKKEKLTPEKLAELEKKYPEINWRNDTLATEGPQAARDSVDTKSPALRPGF